MESKKISNLLLRAEIAFNSRKTRSYEWRIAQLKQLKKLLKENEVQIIDALAKDLGRPPFEGCGLEIIPLDMEIDFCIKNLKKWMETPLTPVPLIMAPANSQTVYEPYGVCLIIGAFNYPVDLVLGPLIGAIMTGNCAIIKPSELAPSCESLMSNLLPLYLDPECFQVVCGGVSTTTALLEQPWGKIVFTGSTRVGKIVMQAAAKYLTPVLLELGGKSPVIIDESVTNMEVVARRIMWGKCANAGQTCIAPDYVLCHEKQYDAYLQASVKVLRTFYGKNPKDSVDFGRIISKAHCERIQKLLEENPVANLLLLD